VYANYESLISLAAAAAVTERIRLATDILIAPLRANSALLAKQAATIDNLSGGRLTLGLAVGGREDDYSASGVDFHQRGQIFERQLQEMSAVWAGERGIGPAPASNGRPRLLIGGTSDVAFQRAARYGDGWTMGGGTPDHFRQALEKLGAAWNHAGRAGAPRTLVLFYFALGDDASQIASATLGDYYSFLGDIAQQIIGGAAKDADTVKAYLAAFEAAGADEVICFPVSADPRQVDLLAEAAL
jgi:alkanesulfonate monooxygenase SsuD/methylene tetrahydromethanopterin reductase-like flavin-dependent oxidoreductase (luciferase family)